MSQERFITVCVNWNSTARSHVCHSVIDKCFFSLSVFLVGSRNYLQLQHFTHFMITAEAIDVETNRATVAGPKRVGRFQLFGDSLTKFYENCVNTVAEADDLAKTEVQVSLNDHYLQVFRVFYLLFTFDWKTNWRFQFVLQWKNIHSSKFIFL